MFGGGGAPGAPGRQAWHGDRIALFLLLIATNDVGMIVKNRARGTVRAPYHRVSVLRSIFDRGHIGRNAGACGRDLAGGVGLSALDWP